MAEVIPQGGPDGNSSDTVARKNSDIVILTATAMYYEWNAGANRWMKLVESDPDPDPNLQPGRFDGQIIEVPRPT